MNDKRALINCLNRLNCLFAFSRLSIPFFVALGLNPMLLLCQVNSQRYSLPTTAVVAVVPWVDLLPLPTHAPGLVGGLTYGGELLPVLDLGLLLGEAPCSTYFSSRIAVIEVMLGREELPEEVSAQGSAARGLAAPVGGLPERSGAAGQRRRLGLRAAGMTALLAAEDCHPLDTSMLGQTSPYLGAPLQSEMGLVQTLNLTQIAVHLMSTALAVSP